MTRAKPTRRTVRRRMWGGFCDGRLHLHDTYKVVQCELFKFKREAKLSYEDIRPVLVTWSAPKPKTTKRKERK